MIARVTTFALDGVESRRVWVEADIRLGLPAFTIVGLADKAVREARERVRAAIVNSGHEFPSKRITVNLAPAYLRKIGPGFDLPLAIAILVASDQLEPDAVEGTAIVGELSLTGDVRAIRGALAISEGTRRHLLERLLLPRARAREAALVPGVTVLGIESLTEAVDVLAGRADPQPVPDPPAEMEPDPMLDLADVRGQNALIPGLEVAAAGGHNLFMHGPPGHRQDDAGAPPALDPAADDRRRGGRRHAHPLGRRAPRRRRAGAPAAVPRAAPHDLLVRPGRRRLAPAARRGDARAPRRPVPRRAVGVRALEPRGAAPAARGRPRDDRALAAGRRVPDALHARRRLQPVPVRHGGRGVPLHRRRPRAPPAPALRPAARPHRRARPGRPADGRRAARRSRRPPRPRSAPA